MNSNTAVRASSRVAQSAASASSRLSVAKKLSATVPTVPDATHVTGHVVRAEQRPVVPRGVLTAPIRVMQHAGARLATGKRHRERRPGQRPFERVPHRPADHAARHEIEHDGQVEPALACGEIRVSRPGRFSPSPSQNRT